MAGDDWDKILLRERVIQVLELVPHPNCFMGNKNMFKSNQQFTNLIIYINRKSSLKQTLTK